MGIIDSLRERRANLVASTMVSITEIGNRAADADLEHGAAFTILSQLSDHSPMSISGLARQCRMDVFKTMKEVERLKRQQKVSCSDYNEN